ncbi:hypothetical protein MHM83_08830 [Tenacibaculum sp. Mcav3-52]|uniref:DUF4136 domain-containing protein n=1 Tax=Tenacibaculum sp. Pbs-1 TaxID=3238748 RepID=A0AB33KY63_9FLAO|nr:MULTISPECIES: hypothetical protein [unclassified Tenacibaculum]BFF38752.1 hypothetical protein BACY1_05570 [Tenacibaculum mesophilum]GFD75617.1 hypothetical protein KUL113_50370 [Tenacibaculum sp. KUL113]GFD81257.1 hypothetical protein KUL118_41190 [Tenacibaculum sp. KUL118]MCG7501972.1 hypothetical protein [Tenacibaculum sp. Mcav3-52]MCO7185262.1 hypothetical protein [Tenacibaculum sp. XPcli2-G]
MKKLLLAIAFAVSSFSVVAQSYEYKVITSVESTVPNGMGRSRLLSSNESRDFKDFTSTRSDDKEKDKRNKSDRSEIRVKNFEETKLLNFFNLGGIRFQNIVANDAVISSKINTMTEEGWDLAFVNTGVESYGGKGDKNGLFITRYIFKRLKK